MHKWFVEGFVKIKTEISNFEEKFGIVPPSRPNMNEILKDARDLARIWDLYGHPLKEN